MTSPQTKYLLYFVFSMLVFTTCKPDAPITVESEDSDEAIVVEEPSTTPSKYQNRLDKVNDLRTSGCRCGDQTMPPTGPLRWNQKLAKAAEQHSQDMADNQHFSHTGTNGSSTGDRIQQQGYNWQTYGENIAQGHASANKVFQAWLDSPGHCLNMMKAEFEEMGAAEKNRYWTQTFGRSF